MAERKRPARKAGTRVKAGRPEPDMASAVEEEAAPDLIVAGETAETPEVPESADAPESAEAPEAPVAMEAAAATEAAETATSAGDATPAEPDQISVAGEPVDLPVPDPQAPVSDELKAIIEALIFASPEPLTLKALCKVLSGEPKEDVERALEALKLDYQQPGGLQLIEIAGGLQLVTRTDLNEWVRRLFHERKSTKLSVQALETLAVIAYRQPVTSAEIAEIRGVNTSGVLATLIERKLVKIAGRKPVVGRPFLYATTREFLMRFGLNDLGDLPKVEDMADLLGFDLSTALSEPMPSDQFLPLEVPGEEAVEAVSTPARAGETSDAGRLDEPVSDELTSDAETRDDLRSDAATPDELAPDAETRDDLRADAETRDDLAPHEATPDVLAPDAATPDEPPTAPEAVETGESDEETVH